MNNDQFRRLVFDKPSAKTSSSHRATPQDASPDEKAGRGNATPSGAGGLLGSRMRSSIPMTPRSVTGGDDFARQLAEYRRESQPATKRFKSSAAPKGSRLPAGYQDRAAQLRAQEVDENETSEGNNGDLASRLKALEEMVKLGQIEQTTFDQLRKELGVGGDLKSTHLVKGLDWDLLRRVKTGEDVSKMEEEQLAAKEEETAEPEEDVDDAFDRVLDEQQGQQDVLPSVPKAKEKKKGSMAPPPPGKKSRDEILRELKASRAAAAAAAQEPTEPALGSRFKRIGDSKVEKKRWVEQDENGRRKEILQITDADGKMKRKVRWLDKPGQSGPLTGLLMPELGAKPLGMEVPAEMVSKALAPAPEEDDDDIFAGVGDEYNPLGDDDEDDSDSSDSSEEDGEVDKKPAADVAPSTEPTKPSPSEPPAKARNYFSTSANEDASEPLDRSNPLTRDPTILAALKRAATLRQGSPSNEDEAGDADSDTLLRRRKFIEEARRQDALDAMDMDMGFGSSRIEDDEDEEAVVLEGENRGGKKRKRGPKKRKGDKDSASDVMRVLDGRKKDE
ncbi:hypothetical protein FE257_007587 [Aspergillus nanangensis]|uniref:RED-like N-terminal domain-containing protein n=1 Tax=Aspergillus nanangensis TaxID=2582783 RepID=A0AAD4GT88_ASPNN|nr:hypothetical protein FE257_007587 [Aspergillus nanangensis]